MTTDNLTQLENEVRKIKNELRKMGPMRPGSLTLQYKVPAERRGPYQLSYTHKMKSKTQYVRPQWVAEIRKQIEVYKRFKKLIEEWIELSIESSQIKTKQVKKAEKGK
jgi:hypothetical protein